MKKERSRIISEIVNTCDQRKSDIEGALVAHTSYTSIVQHINTSSNWKTTYENGDATAVRSLINNAGNGLFTSNFINLVGYDNADWCIDSQGIVHVSYYFATFYEALREFLKQSGDGSSASAMNYVSQMYFKGSGSSIMIQTV